MSDTGPRDTVNAIRRILRWGVGMDYRDALDQVRKLLMPTGSGPANSKYGDPFFWSHIKSLEARRDKPNVPGVPSEALSREQANRICYNVRALVSRLEEKDADLAAALGDERGRAMAYIKNMARERRTEAAAEDDKPLGGHSYHRDERARTLARLDAAAGVLDLLAAQLEEGAHCTPPKEESDG